MNALKVTNCIFKRLTVDETETNYDNGWYIEDFSNSRMWFHGCTFQSDWFDTGAYDLVRILVSLVSCELVREKENEFHLRIATLIKHQTDQLVLT